jgi:putative Holliday junction resolvase
MPDTPDADPTDRTVIAFDFGTRRIGVATGNNITRSAQPLTTLNATDSRRLWLELDRIITEWEPDQLLVGLPDQDESGITRTAAEQFAAELKSRYPLPLDMVPEHLTSFAAESELKESRREGRKTRRVRLGEVDAVAARLIAEQWLNAQHD